MDPSVHLHKHRGWLLVYGIILILLGLVAISVAALTTLLSVMFLGGVLLVVGIFSIFDSFKSWRHRLSSFILHLILALLFIVAGLMLILKPAVGAISLTLLLAIFYLAVGIFRILSAMALRLPYWGWRLLSGVIALVISALILVYLPASSLLIIGLLIGVDLLFSGWALVILGLTKNIASPIRVR